MNKSRPTIVAIDKKQKNLLCNNNIVYIDVGSSTIKIYKYSDQGLSLLATKSLHFEQDYDPAIGINEYNKKALINVVKTVRNDNKDANIKIFATALFRKLTKNAKFKFCDDFFRETGLCFNIVEHDLEGFYLEKALSSKYTLDAFLLLINIGGGSTELVIKWGEQVMTRYNLDIGVGFVLNEFPLVNERYSSHSLEEVVSSIKKILPKFNKKIRLAIYNGGELTYMKLVGYKLENNTIFEDSDHPYYVTSENFIAKNQEVYNSITLKKLESCMPNDPLWMHGARACSAIAQAIVEHFGVEIIIPSDSNMIHGAVKQEYRSVVLTGSFRKHLSYILDVKSQLISQGVDIMSPRFDTPKNPGEEFVIFDGEEGKSPLELERHHLDMIDRCDALIVCSPHGYVGASSMLEIGYAQFIGKRIIFTEKPEEFMLQTLPAVVGL